MDVTLISLTIPIRSIEGFTNTNLILVNNNPGIIIPRMFKFCDRANRHLINQKTNKKSKTEINFFLKITNSA